MANEDLDFGTMPVKQLRREIERETARHGKFLQQEWEAVQARAQSSHRLNMLHLYLGTALVEGGQPTGKGSRAPKEQGIREKETAGATA